MSGVAAVDQAGSDESAELAARNLHRRLMTSGHERQEGDACTICFLPVEMPMGEHSRTNFCCLRRVCDGCILAAQRRGIYSRCPFCRQPFTRLDDHASLLAMVRKRADKGDARAKKVLGEQYYDGKLGLTKDVTRAIALWTEAAELGCIGAYFELGLVYHDGLGVEKDEAKGIQYWQHAAMNGDVSSRGCLGVTELQAGNFENALQHLMISAKMGEEVSLNGIRGLLMDGHATKAQYAEALLGYQDAVEEVKSPQREEAKRLRGS
ncbi:hypothetical protein THAOC_22244 [Thalassiosira oceanica]|uniref:RING-type domain-containing protein n=1 Tax=Thalassiosira oceanica TaxID=159749 RepID=K0RZ43_THAOC|nr:hypothetical protein THAOC_22244 [Thalassiosira oceanica]|eukprot:EJK57684.1 hypothetical protein THAOC_22244 [Thalassiosira oceanica]